MIIYSPLEQFRVYPIISFFYERLSFTNSAFFLLLNLAIITLIAYGVSRNATIIPTPYQIMLESLYTFIRDMVDDILGDDGRKYFPLFFFLFLFIFTCNLFGLVPYSFTVTSHIIVTFTLALSLFIGINIIGFRTHKLHFFSIFMPSGISIALAPFLITIEIISYISRVFSLSIRLFANMLAGHCLLKILAGFVWTMLTYGGILAILTPFPFVIVIGITGLEVAIAFLQAYVFTILSCMYLNDAINLH